MHELYYSETGDIPVFRTFAQEGQTQIRFFWIEAHSVVAEFLPLPITADQFRAIFSVWHADMTHLNGGYLFRRHDLRKASEREARYARERVIRAEQRWADWESLQGPDASW